MCFLGVAQELFLMLSAIHAESAPAAAMYRVLDQLGQLLSVSGFVVVVSELLHSEDPGVCARQVVACVRMAVSPTPNGQHHHQHQVRKRALQFFNSKVQARKATMNRAEVGLLLELLTVRMLALVKPITTPNP